MDDTLKLGTETGGVVVVGFVTAWLCATMGVAVKGLIALVSAKPESVELDV